jgi:peptidoglycan/LPS O-acetylase OafA/YrhL
MSDLVPGGGRPPSRRERERRAYQLVVVGGTAGVVAVVGFVLALVTSFPGTVAFLAAIVAVVCVVLFRRMTR